MTCEQVSSPVFKIPDHGESSTGLENSIELLGCFIVIRAPVEGLSDDNNIRPVIFDWGVIKVPFIGGNTGVLRLVYEDLTHPFAGLEGF